MSDNYDDHGAELATKDAEIERLREELAVEKGWVSQYRDSYCKQVAEIERLRIKVKEWSDLAIDHTTVIGQLHTEIDLLKSENKKLRNAAAKLFFDSEGDTQYFDSWLENFLQEGE